MAIFYTDTSSIVNLQVSGTLIVSGSTTFSGGINLVSGLGGLTGSLFGTASYSINGFPYNGNAQITGSLNISGSTMLDSTLLSTKLTSSLGIATTTVSRVWTGSYSGAFWDYVVNNNTNFRAGTVMGVWNKVGSAQYTDTSTPDIGDTSQLTFGVVINGEYAELKSTTTTSGWNIRIFERAI